VGDNKLTTQRRERERREREDDRFDDTWLGRSLFLS
jgi:hypothetical protein